MQNNLYLFPELFYMYCVCVLFEKWHQKAENKAGFCAKFLFNATKLRQYFMLGAGKSIIWHSKNFMTRQYMVGYMVR